MPFVTTQTQHMRHNAATPYFWKKKAAVSFVLSIFVIWIHTSVFDHYPSDGSLISRGNELLCFLTKSAFSLEAVPLFFIISGAVFFRNYEKNQYRKKVYTRLKSLLIPYLIWNTANMLFYIVTSYSFISNYFLGRQKFLITIPNLFQGIFFYKCNGPFWYIFDLIVFVLCTPLIDFMLSRKWLARGCILTLAILMQFQIGLPTKLFFSQDAIIFYLLGGMIGKYHFDSFTQKATTKESIGAVMAIAAIILLFFAEYFQLFQLPVFLKTVMLACYCIAFWRAADLWVDRLPSGRYIEYSFLIYAMHVNVSAVITKICYLLFPRSSIFALPNFVVTTVLTVVCICVFAAVLQHRFPRIYRVAVGSR